MTGVISPFSLLTLTKDMQVVEDCFLYGTFELLDVVMTYPEDRLLSVAKDEPRSRAANLQFVS